MINIEKEIIEIQRIFPNLYLKDNNIEGEINICAIYNGKRLIHNPDKTDKDKYFTTFVEEVYEIKISLLDGKVYEIGKKIEKNADNHINKDGSCCLGQSDNPKFENLCEFIKNYVCPFFTWHAYKSKYHVTPPWGEWSHGYQGRQEFEQAKKNLRRNDLCLCGSGKKNKNCCKTNL